MKLIIIGLLLFISFSAFSQKKDSLEIKIIIAQNIRLRQTNEILNKFYNYFGGQPTFPRSVFFVVGFSIPLNQL